MISITRVTLLDHVVCPYGCVGLIGGGAAGGSRRGGTSSPACGTSGPGTKRVILTFHAARSADVRTAASPVGVVTIFPTTEAGAP